MTSSNRKLVPAAVPSGISPGSPQLIPVNIYHYENIRILSLVWIVYELKRNLMKSKRIVSEQKSFYVKGILEVVEIDIYLQRLSIDVYLLKQLGGECDRVLSL